MMRESDYLQQLANYVKKLLAKGYTLASLRTALEMQHYSKTIIDKAILLANSQLAAQAPKLVEKPRVTVTTEPRVEIETKGFWQKVKDFFE